MHMITTRYLRLWEGDCASPHAEGMFRGPRLGYNFSQRFGAERDAGGVELQHI